MRRIPRSECHVGWGVDRPWSLSFALGRSGRQRCVCSVQGSFCGVGCVKESPCWPSTGGRVFGGDRGLWGPSTPNKQHSLIFITSISGHCTCVRVHSYVVVTSCRLEKENGPSRETGENPVVLAVSITALCSIPKVPCVAWRGRHKNSGDTKVSHP